MNAATAALTEYANPRNWTRKNVWDQTLAQIESRWVFIDDEPWARAQDALDKESDMSTTEHPAVRTEC